MKKEGAVRDKGINNNIPEVHRNCEGCFAAVDGKCAALKEIIDPYTFKKPKESEVSV